MRAGCEQPCAPPRSGSRVIATPASLIACSSAARWMPGSPVASYARVGSGSPSVCDPSYLGIPQPGQLATPSHVHWTIELGLTTISRPSTSGSCVPANSRCAAASLNRLAATVQEGRSGRSQPLGKPCSVLPGAAGMCQTKWRSGRIAEPHAPSGAEASAGADLLSRLAPEDPPR
jgi:hypothetical protein